jgi:hypothetical protein
MPLMFSPLPCHFHIISTLRRRDAILRSPPFHFRFSFTRLFLFITPLRHIDDAISDYFAVSIISMFHCRHTPLISLPPADAAFAILRRHFACYAFD